MKKVKFPLVLRDDYPVRNMEELKEHFDIEKLYQYLCDGRLLAWLEDRQYGEAERIKNCEKVDMHLAEIVCEIFQVEYKDEYSEKIKALQKAKTDFILVGKKEDKNEFKHFLSKSGVIIKKVRENLEEFGNQEDGIDEVMQLEENFGEKISSFYGREPSEEKSDNGKADVGYTYSVAEVKAYANQEDLLEEDLEEVFLSSDSVVIRKGETVRYSNKILHFSTDVTCAGEMMIYRCVIVYDGNYSLVLERDAKLNISDSLFECRGNRGYNEFIRSGYDSRDLFVNIENSTFLGCSNLIKLEHAENISIKHCRIKNCHDGFLNVRMNSQDNTSKLDISENLIMCEERKAFHVEGEGTMFLIKAPISNTDSFNFHDNVIYESDVFLTINGWSSTKLTIVESQGLNVYNCDFYGVKNVNGWNVLRNVHNIHHCRFMKCENIIGDSCENKKLINIKNCVFDRCTAVVNDVGRGVNIQKCQFIGCYDKLIAARETAVYIAYCEFENIRSAFEKVGRYFTDAEYRTCILLPELEGSNKNVIENCTFNGIYMQKIKDDIDAGFFIASKDVCDVPSHLFTIIRNCCFKNCRTDRTSNSLIKQKVKYVKIFGRDRYYQICDILDCDGYENVGKESDHVENCVLWETDETGNIIGASSVVPRSKKWEK